MADTFLSHFLEHTKHYESPESFWKWGALTAIAGVTRDSCYRRMGDQKLYPNIYTLLLADSAVHRKGQPVVLCERLVKDVNSTKIISGRSSIQGILDELAKGETDKSTGKLLSGGSATFFASELSAGIVNDPEAIKIFTDIYDFKPEYVSRLRGSGIFRIKNICFSMLGASNEELLVDLYDTKALFGGLLGRTFLVKPNEFRPANSLFTIQDTSESYRHLAGLLTAISRVNGEFDFTIQAQRCYDNWYIPFRDSYKGRSDKSGIAGRIHTSILKVAMLLCLDQTQNLTVSHEHISESIRICTALMPNYTSFVMSTGKSGTADIAAQLIEDIWTSKTKTISKSEFLTRHFHRFALDDIDKCIQTLSQAELIKQNIDMAKAEESYTITEKCKTVFGLKEEEKPNVEKKSKLDT